MKGKYERRWMRCGEWSNLDKSIEHKIESGILFHVHILCMIFIHFQSSGFPTREQIKNERSRMIARLCSSFGTTLTCFMLDTSLNSMFQSNRRSISCNFTDESINATVALRFNQESSNTMNAVTLVRDSRKTTRPRIFHTFWRFWQMNNCSHSGTPLLIPWTNSFRSKDCSKRSNFCKNYFALLWFIFCNDP